jgi:hypothetical protein|tara:strand:+ start:416 stop:700 length:285 start_codon:yes stop_codon:yes gene_type:complete
LSAGCSSFSKRSIGFELSFFYYGFASSLYLASSAWAPSITASASFYGSYSATTTGRAAVAFPAPYAGAATFCGVFAPIAELLLSETAVVAPSIA